MVRLILGSQSPRRKEILEYFGYPFEVKPSNFNEDSVPFSGKPANYVSKIAAKKAKSLYYIYPDAAIITADTIVYREGKIYGKPHDEKEAFQYLAELSRNWHSVYTGISVLRNDLEFHAAEETRVLFNSLTQEQIRAYLHKTHWSDKAGAYAIQQGGGILVKRIEGCFYNVMGLPINTTQELLKKIGIDLWQYLK